MTVAMEGAKDTTEKTARKREVTKTLRTTMTDTSQEKRISSVPIQAILTPVQATEAAQVMATTNFLINLPFKTIRQASSSKSDSPDFQVRLIFSFISNARQLS